MIAELIAWDVDHGIYRAGTGRAKCSRCRTPITPGEAIRVPADLNDGGRWWHESCPPEPHSIHEGESK